LGRGLSGLTKQNFVKSEPNLMKKSAQTDANTAHWLYKGGDKKKFVPPHTPFPGARDGQNLISSRWSLPLPTNPVW